MICSPQTPCLAIAFGPSEEGRHRTEAIGTAMSDNRPLRHRVLSLARGIAGGYATRLLTDLGAASAQLRWSADRPGDWPESDSFRAYFTRRVEVVDQPLSLPDLFDQLPRLAPAFDLIITDFSACEVGAGSLYERVRQANRQVVVANVDHFGRIGPYAGWHGDEL